MSNPTAQDVANVASTILTQDSLASLINFGIKFGIDAALAIAQAFKGGATIDDAIAALEAAKTKTAQQYLAEAQSAVQP